MDMPVSDMPAGSNMQQMPMIACPSCGAQMQLNATPMEAMPEQQEQMPPGEPDGDEGQPMGADMASPEADEFDNQAATLEAKRGKPFRDKSGVAAALREYRG